MSKEDYLTEDSIIPPNQKWECISFFSKNHVRQAVENNNDYLNDENKEKYSVENNVFAIKSRGTFETFEDASAHAKRLRDLDPYHNVYVAEKGKWCAFILEESENDKYAKQTEHANQELNEMMKKYVENQEKSKIYHELRKNQMIIKNLDENITNRNTYLQETKDLLLQASDKEERKSLKEKLLAIDDQISKMEERKKELMEKEVELSKTLKMEDLKV